MSEESAPNLRVVVLTAFVPTSVWVVNNLIETGCIVGIIVEDPPPTNLKVKLRNLWRRLRRYGLVFAVDELLYNIYRYFKVREDYSQKVREHFFAGSDEIEFDPSIPLTTVASMNSDKAAAAISDLRPDLTVVCGTSLLKRHIFSIAKQGTINIHCGITPEYRGAGNIWALYHGDYDNVGVTIHYIDKGIDTGEIIAQEKVACDPKVDDPDSVYFKSLAAGARLFIETIKAVADGSVSTHVKPASPSRFYSSIGLRRYLKLKRQLRRERK